MATFRQRKGKWQVQVRRNGETVSRTFFLKSDAQQWGHQTELEADRKGLPTNRASLNGITVSDLLERFRDTVAPRRRGGGLTVFLYQRDREIIASTRPDLEVAGTG